MFSTWTPQFDANDLTTFDNNNFWSGNSVSSGSGHLDPWNVAGPSQEYAGVDVLGDLNGYPDILSPSTAPISLEPSNIPYPHEWYASSPYLGINTPSSSQGSTIPFHPPSYSSSPVPILSRGSPSLSPDSSTAPTTPTVNLSPQPQVIANLGGLDFSFPAVAESLSLHAAHPTLVNGPTWEELWSQLHPPDPFYFDLPPSDSDMGGTIPGVPIPMPASSSGPKRTRQPVREARRHNPLRGAKKKAEADFDSEGWDRTLLRFRAHLDTLCNFQNGQPSGGFVPETALAKMNKFIKEDLKRSPLRNTRAGEGKRSRDVETYLEGLLQEIRQANPAPVLAEGDSNEGSTTVDALSNLANELEARLVAVNPQPALRRATNVPEAGKKVNGSQSEKQKKRGGLEKERRDNERFQVERISRLFSASGKNWAKKDVLSLAAVFLLCGPAAFPRDFVRVRHTTMGL